MTIPALMPDAQWPLFVIGILCTLLVWLTLFELHQEHNKTRRLAGEPTKTFGQHLKTKAGPHALGLIPALIGVAILLGVGVAALVLYHGGARFDPHKHVAPHVRAGGSTGQALPNLYSQVVHGENQGDTNACWSFGATNALYTAEVQRGMRPFAASPWRTFYYGAGGRNDTGTLEEAVATINGYGVEPLADWPSLGPPDSHDQGVTLAYHGARVRTVYYGAGYGTLATAAIDSELRAGHVLVILWDVHQGALQSGQAILHNTGGHVFYHFSIIYGEALLPDGSLGFSVANTWGGNWGQQGDALWPVGEVEQYALAASVIEPGSPIAQWLPPVPTPRPTSTPRPHPIATPHATSKPAPCVVHSLLVTANANARAVPKLSAPPLFGLGKGQKVTTVCGLGVTSTAHWQEIATQQNRIGYVLKSVLR